jgi:hypothetical protein
MAQRPTSHTSIAVVHGLYHVTERRGAAAKECVRYLYKTFKSCKNKKAQKRIKPDTKIERRVCQIDVILLHASASVRGETSRARGNEAWPYRGGVSGAVARVLRLCHQWGRQHGGTAHDGEKDTADLACVWSCCAGSCVLYFPTFWTKYLLSLD